MNLSITWDLYMDVTTPDKAKRLVEKLAALTDIQFELDSLERYGKGKITYKASLKSNVEGSSVAEAMWATVKKANRIARTWAITGTDLEEDDFSEVIGTALPKTIDVQGVESMEFHIETGPNTRVGQIDQALAI